MDLKIQDVIELLNISEATLQQWLAEGKIPSYTLNNQVRFNRSEIENWVMSHKEISPFSTNNQAEALKMGGGQKQYSLFRALHRGEVFTDLKGETKEDIIRQAAKNIAPTLDLDADILSDLLLDREKLQTTALGHGIAVPHTRDLLNKGPHDMVTIVFPSRPIPYDALDQKPVSTLFFIFASQDARHLHLLAKIAHLSSQPDILKLLEQKPGKEALLEFIKDWESAISHR